ncbi:MAG: putative phage protein, partial [Frankiales bacterium]|nr:putative phage protein [Frankiales bacterium]
MTDTTNPVVTQLAALTVEARRIADALTAPLPGKDGLTVSTCPRTDRHGYHMWADADRTAICPGHPAPPPVDVAAAMTGVTPGGNAEDCPRCTDPNPDYPFLCPGHPATDNSSDPAACGHTLPHPAHRYMQWGQVHQCRGAEAQERGEETTRHVGTSTIGETATPGRATITIAVTAPNQDNANRWAGTIRDLVTAEHGHHMRLDITISDGQQYEQDSDDGLREQYMKQLTAEVQRLGDRCRAVTSRAKQAEAERDKALTAFNAVTLKLEDAKAINAEACQIIDMQKELIGTERRIVMTAMSHREDEGARIEHCDHCGRDHMGELDEAIQAADVAYAKAFPASADGPRRPGRLPDEGPAAAESSPDGDTCRPLEINGETIHFHGSRDLTDQERSYASDIVSAAKRKFAAEHAAPADRAQQRGGVDAEPEPHTGLVVKAYSDHGLQRWVFRCWGTDTCDGWLSLEHSTQSSAE